MSLPGRRRQLASIVGFVLLGTIWAPTANASLAQQSRTPVPESSRWKHYVIDPGKVVYPKAVYVVGAPANVQNPRGLKAPGGGRNHHHRRPE